MRVALDSAFHSPFTSFRHVSCLYLTTSYNLISMTSFYSRLAHETWQASRAQSAQVYLSSAEDPSHPTGRRTSRISTLEARAEAAEDATCRFGDRWLRPIGCAKTRAQLEEEAGEVSQSYEAYHDEDGGELQHTEGEDVLTELDEHEERDLDEEVEQGASFSIDSDYGEAPAQRQQQHHQQGQHAIPGQEEDVGMLSAEEASEHSYGDLEESD